MKYFYSDVVRRKCSNCKFKDKCKKSYINNACDYWKHNPKMSKELK